MKKFITLILMAFMINISFAQESKSEQTDDLVTTVATAAEYVTDGNAEKLVDKYTAKINAAIVAFAEMLKQPAEEQRQ
jgi:hypothetical protein